MSSKKQLSDPEQFLLQQFLNRGVLDQFNFKELFKNILKKFKVHYNHQDNDQFKQLIVTYIKSINEAIRPFSLEIKNGTCELTGITFYCLIRMFDGNAIGNLSQLYNTNELKAFKIIISKIIESEDGYLTINTLVSELCEQDQFKLTNKDSRQLIEKFIKDFWLTIESNNRVALHGRAILELGQYLLEVYNDEEHQAIVNCILCKEIVISGITCPNCPSKLHRFCAKKYFKNQSDCMSCKKPMTNEEILAFREQLRLNALNSTQNSKQNTTLNSTQANGSPKKVKRT